MGVHLKLTPAVSKKICESLVKCYPRATAAAIVGISPSTLSVWMSKGEQGEAPYDEFYKQVLESEALSMSRLIDVVYNEAELSPKIALRLLISRMPSDFGRHDNVTVSHGLAQAPDGSSAVDELVRRFAKMAVNMRELAAPADPKPE